MPNEGLGMVEVELKIEDCKRNIIGRFHNITGSIYENIDNVGRDAASLNFGKISGCSTRFFVCDLFFLIVTVVNEWSFVR